MYSKSLFGRPLTWLGAGCRTTSPARARANIAATSGRVIRPSSSTSPQPGRAAASSRSPGSENGPASSSRTPDSPAASTISMAPRTRLMSPT